MSNASDSTSTENESNEKTTSHDESEIETRPRKLKKKKRNICPQCKQKFKYPSQLKRHLEMKQSCTDEGARDNPKSYSCDACGEEFTRPDNLQRHITSSCKGKVATQPIVFQVKMDNMLNDSSFRHRIINEINNEQKSLPLNFSYVNFAEEKISDVSLGDLYEILHSEYSIIEAYLLNVLLNPNKPQNHNMIYSMSDDIGMIYVYPKWRVMRICSLLNLLTENIIEKLDDITEKFKDVISSHVVAKIKRKLANVNRKRIAPYLKQHLCNNENMIIQTQKMHETNLRRDKNKSIKFEDSESEPECRIFDQYVNRKISRIHSHKKVKRIPRRKIKSNPDVYIRRRKAKNSEEDYQSDDKKSKETLCNNCSNLIDGSSSEYYKFPKYRSRSRYRHLNRRRLRNSDSETDHSDDKHSKRNRKRSNDKHRE